MSEDIRGRISNDFAFHPAVSDDQKARHTEVRRACRDLALLLAVVVPEGRERSLALTRLEEAMFWANAGVARVMPIGEEVTI